MIDTDGSEMGLDAELEMLGAQPWYKLPKGWTWQDVVEQRAKGEVNPRFLPIGSAGGAVAWGRPTPNDFKRARKSKNLEFTGKF